MRIVQRFAWISKGQRTSALIFVLLFACFVLFCLLLKRKSLKYVRRKPAAAAFPYPSVQYLILYCCDHDAVVYVCCREFRTLVIDMVLATDMSFHFQQIKNMKNLLSMPEK